MPQPIDMQTELGRAIMAERIQELSGRVSLAALQRSANETDEARVLAETQVDETKESQGKGVDAESRRKVPYVTRRRKRRKKRTDEDERARMFYSDKEESSVADSPEDHQFDVTV